MKVLHLSKVSVQDGLMDRGKKKEFKGFDISYLLQSWVFASMLGRVDGRLWCGVSEKLG